MNSQVLFRDLGTGGEDRVTIAYPAEADPSSVAAGHRGEGDDDRVADEERGAEKELQKITDRFVHEVDENLKRKEQELTEV